MAYEDLTSYLIGWLLGLITQGIKAGDRILMVAENSVEVGGCILRCVEGRGGTLPSPCLDQADKLRAIIESTEPSTILAQARFLSVVDSALSGADHIPLKIAFGTLPTSATEDWLAYEAIATHDGKAERSRDWWTAMRWRFCPHIGFDRHAEGRDA